MRIANIEFKESTYYTYKAGKVYRNTASGQHLEKWSIARNCGAYKIHAEHFNCALPYTKYYVIDLKHEVIYESHDCFYSYLNDLAAELKAM